MWRPRHVIRAAGDSGCTIGGAVPEFGRPAAHIRESIVGPPGLTPPFGCLLWAARSAVACPVCLWGGAAWHGGCALLPRWWSALGFGATPCRLVSLIHTCVGPYDRARDVRNASDMKVNRMSLALAALGQRAAMASELAGFGRNFRAGMHSMVSKKLAFKSSQTPRPLSLAPPVSDRANKFPARRDMGCKTHGRNR